MLSFSDFFPFWDQLTREQREEIRQYSSLRTARKGEIIHNGSNDCLGLLLICSGQLRAYIVSEEGREITVYRLCERDICLLSASCMMQSIQFDITIEAEKDTQMWVIPPDIYRRLMENSAPAANYTNQIMGDRFSEVMWLLEQIMWKSFDKRLAGFLLEESRLEDSLSLKITHEKIANHMGTAREVVTRMLRYFQKEGLVRLTRGTVEILDLKGLSRLQDS